LKNGLLVVELRKVIPEQMKARRIPIGETNLRTIEASESKDDKQAAA
jgi:molecular chaperone IbpA